MNKQTEALKMAIEAMSCISQSRGDPLLKAIRACKEALEQEERTQRTMHCGTADAFIAMDDEHKRRWFVQSLRESQRRKELEDMLEQPAQEPVYFISGDTGWEQVSKERYDKERWDDDKWLLYTYPAPSWQGLSDDEIKGFKKTLRLRVDYWINHYDRKSGADMELLRKHVSEEAERIARAIEQALKEKNHG